MDPAVTAAIVAAMATLIVAIVSSITAVMAARAKVRAEKELEEMRLKHARELETLRVEENQKAGVLRQQGEIDRDRAAFGLEIMRQRLAALEDVSQALQNLRDKTRQSLQNLAQEITRKDVSEEIEALTDAYFLAHELGLGEVPAAASALTNTYAQLHMRLTPWDRALVHDAKNLTGMLLRTRTELARDSNQPSLLEKLNNIIELLGWIQREILNSRDELVKAIGALDELNDRLEDASEKELRWKAAIRRFREEGHPPEVLMPMRYVMSEEQEGEL